MVRLKAYTEIHKNSASQEWGSSGEALWSSGIWAEPVKFNILCCSSSDKHWCKCLCGLGPGWATAWGVKMNKARSYSSLHSFQNTFSLFFLPFYKCVWHTWHSPVCRCIHVLRIGMCAGICMHTGACEVDAGSWHQGSSSTNLHFMYESQVSCWTWSLPF